MIRRPRATEIKLLPQIEKEADRRYARAGLRRVLDMQPAGLASLEQGRRGGLLWLAVSRVGRPVGFALMKVHGGTIWLDQLSVLDRWQRHGHGAALIDSSAARARALWFDALYLSTYRDVPWNGPYYKRRGFEEVPRSAFTRPLRIVLLTERSQGHPVWHEKAAPGL